MIEPAQIAVGTYRYSRMPFSLGNYPKNFQRALEISLYGLHRGLFPVPFAIGLLWILFLV